MMYSDRQIITFIMENHDKKNKLNDFFLNLNQPLSERVLSCVLPLSIKGKGMNFLAYAIKYDYFINILKLASHNDVGKALSKEAVNDESMHCMNIILYRSIKYYKIYNFIELIKKVDATALEESLQKKSMQWTSFMMALSLEDLAFSTLINKVSAKALNKSIRKAQNNRSIKMILIDHNSFKMCALFEKLESKTADFLMKQPFRDINGDVWPHAFLFLIRPTPFVIDSRYDRENISKWIKKLTPEFINEILPVSFKGENSFTSIFKKSEEIFEIWLEKVDKSLLNKLLLSLNPSQFMVDLIQFGTFRKNNDLLNKLDTPVIDFILSSPITRRLKNYNNTLSFMIKEHDNLENNIIYHLESFLKRMSPKALEKLTQIVDVFNKPEPLLLALLKSKASPLLIKSILSNLSQTFINEILWNDLENGEPFLCIALTHYLKLPTKLPLLQSIREKKPFPDTVKKIVSVIVNIIDYISPSVLFESIGDIRISPGPFISPVSEEMEDRVLTQEARLDFFEKISHYDAVLLNTIVNKLLLGQCPLVLPKGSVVKLDALNMSRYLIQRASLNSKSLPYYEHYLDKLKPKKRQEASEGLRKLKTASEEAKVPLNIYDSVTQVGLIQSVALIVMEYMIEDEVIRNNINKYIESNNILPIQDNADDKALISSISQYFKSWNTFSSEYLPISLHWQMGHSIDKEQLIKQATLYGYECKTVQTSQKDKSGFFSAITYALKEKGLGYLAGKPDILRNKIEKYVLNHFQKYKSLLAKKSALSEEEIIQAFSKVMNITIVTLKSNGTYPSVYCSEKEDPIVCIGYECQNDRFRALSHQVSIKSTYSIQELVNHSSVKSEVTSSIVSSLEVKMHF